MRGRPLAQEEKIFAQMRDGGSRSRSSIPFVEGCEIGCSGMHRSYGHEGQLVVVVVLALVLVPVLVLAWTNAVKSVLRGPLATL
jgi:hypothetical protein